MAYNAFISYSHAADSELAAALQSALHRFAKPWYKLRGLHIFRDQTNLAVNPALWSSIRGALDQSQFLILFASPEAAQSVWVEKEAAYWISRNGTGKVLLVLTGGTLGWDRATNSFDKEQTSALAPSVLSAFAEEPLFLDLVWTRNGATPPRFGMREPRFHEAVLQLAATLLNRPKDELDGEDIRARRQSRLLAGAALLALLATGLFGWWQTRVSHEESTRRLAAALASQARQVLTDHPDETREAALLAIESNRLYPTPEGNEALRTAVSLLPASAQFYQADSADPEPRVRDMAFSPNGDILAAVRDNGSTQLIDLAARRSIGYIGPDEKPAASLELTPKGEDGSVGGDNAENAVSVAFDASGSLVASGVRDGFAHVWTRADGREALRIFHGSPVSQVAFHPQAKQLLTATDDGHLRVFDVARGALLSDFACPGKIVTAAFSPDGTLIAALSSEGPVYLFDAVRGRLLRKLFGGGEAALKLAFSGDGKRLATAMGSFAFVWDLSNGTPLLKATHAESAETLATLEWISDVALSPDGKFLAYVSRGDNWARVWNVETGRQILQLPHDSRVAAVAFGADGHKLSTGSYDGTARVWDIPSGREIERSSHAGGAEVVVFSGDGGRVAAGGMDGSISISELRGARNPVVFHLPGDARSLAFSPDNRLVGIGARSEHYQSLVRIADTSGKVVRDIEAKSLPFDKLIFLDTKRLIGQWAARLFLVDMERGSGDLLPTPEWHGDLRIDAAGSAVAVQPDRATELYSLPGLQKMNTVHGPATGLLRVAGRGSLLAFDTSQPPNRFGLEIWSVARQARITRIALPAELSKVAVNPAGTVVFTAEGENMQAWEIPSGKRRFSLTSNGAIHLIVADPSTAFFATVTDTHLTVRDAGNGAALAEFPATSAAAFSNDGRYLLTRTDERSAALWTWRSSDLRDEACGRLSSNLSHAEWSRWLPNQDYRLTCPHLPVGKEE
jgi:WD40 repeat protein